MPSNPRSRRHWLAGLAGACAWACAAGRAAAPVEWLELWVDLDEPVAAGARDAAAARQRLERVMAQQERVARELGALGAVELARVHHARNAIAVRLPSTQVEAARRIPGVLRVRPVRTLHPPEPMPRPPA